jgi:hypothetical protein
MLPQYTASMPKIKAAKITNQLENKGIVYHRVWMKQREFAETIAPTAIIEVVSGKPRIWCDSTRTTFWTPRDITETVVEYVKFLQAQTT